jgi:N-acetylglucosaminyl-diphospho-decaprenol L-rhamnosyltransferase
MMAVVVVNYCSGSWVLDCLGSLQTEVAANPGLRVTIVDNASPDGSADTIEAGIAAGDWNGWAGLIRSPVNGGFSAGNNLGIRAALARRQKPDLFWLLNPDTRVQPGAAASLIRFMGDHPAAGIVGSAIVQADGSPWPFAFRFPTVLSEIERGARLGPLTRLLARQTVLRLMGGEAEQVDWVSGASMVVRRAVLETVGPMDEGYFLYFEETDLCLQARRAGWQTWYLPQAAVVHVAGQSTGLTAPGAKVARVPDYWFDSRRRFFSKNHGRAYAMAADLAWAVAHLSYRLRQRIVPGDPDPPTLLRDFVRRSAWLMGSK